MLAGVLGTVISRMAEKERQKALAGSSVKLQGIDVLASFKIVYGFGVFAAFSVALSGVVFFYCACKE